MLNWLSRTSRLLTSWVRRFLWKASSYDFRIVDDLDLNYQVRFTWLGLLVVLIGLMCFCSTSFAFRELLASRFAAIILGLFVGLLLTNMYFFILYTLHRNTLPSKTKNAGRLFSVSLRLSSIVFIAVLIGQLVGVWCWQEQMHEIVANRKIEQKEEFREILDADEQYLYEQVADFIDADSKGSAETRAIFIEILEEGKVERQQAQIDAEKLISENNMLLYQIGQLHKRYPLSWLITLSVILIFLLPAVLILRMESGHPYYQAINQTHRYLIDQAYLQFTKRYTELIKVKANTYISFEEKYQDPPYNTILKTENKNEDFLSTKDIIESIYGDQE